MSAFPVAVGARISLHCVRGLLKVKHVAPSTVSVVLPYVIAFTNAVLQSVDNKSVQNVLLRKCLLAPSDHLDDLKLWESDNATRAWLRKWWLSNTFRGTAKYHAASAALYDASILPTLGTTKKIFQMKGWRYGDSGRPDADEKRQRAALAKIEAARGNVKDLSTVELLEAAGCAIDKRGPFNAWCESHDTYEFLTAEYVSGLSAYLTTRQLQIQRQVAEDGNGTTKKTVTVLEVGAGNGRLSHFLRRKLKAPSASTSLGTFQVVATDSGGWKLKGADALSAVEDFVPVEKLGFEAALAKYNPDVVLVSWMPMGEDWTEVGREGRV